MLQTIGYVVLLVFLGLIIGNLWILLMKFVTRVTKVFYRPNFLGALPLAIIQSYVSLTLSAIAVLVTRNLLSHNNLIGWVIWLTVFALSMYPSFTFLDYKTPSSKEEQTKDIVIMFVCTISLVGFWILVFFPSVLKLGWGWLPYI